MKNSIWTSWLDEPWLDELLTLIKTQQDPKTQLPILQRVLPKHIKVSNNQAKITLPLGFKGYGQITEIQEQIQKFLLSKGIDEVTFSVDETVRRHTVQRALRSLPKIKNIIAVASGKGGVGKSTTSMNLAIALSQTGAKVGLLDADIYGPSVPTMLGLSGRPNINKNKKIEPRERYGVYTNSIGFMIDNQSPAIWRGPMVVQALEQLLSLTDWPALDYLLIDMPPGTGDIALSLSQKVPLVGAVVVSTPQDLALIDARKAIQMFDKVNVPTLGVVENMSSYVCPCCGHQSDLFGHEGAVKMASQFEVPLLGQVPLTIGIRQSMDAGFPITVSTPDDEASVVYRLMARKLAILVSNRPHDLSAKLPEVKLQTS